MQLKAHGGLALLAAAAALLSACSLAGDVTPPPGQTGPLPTAGFTPTPALADLGYPLAPPAAAEGGLLFLEHCAACHGPSGQGDGELVAQLPAPPPDFTDPALARTRSPAALFAVITTGNIDALMPPFGASLSEAERWSLAAYVGTLSVAPAQLEQGQAVYTANCAACHGPTGQGDGPDAAGLSAAVPDFTDLPTMITRSPQALRAVVAGGDAFHPFAESLSAADQWAAVEAVRAFSYRYAAPEEVLAERTGTVTGQIVNGTAGVAAPGGLSVNLHSFTGSALIETFTVTADAAGAFAFDPVSYTPGRQFLLSTVYGGLTYASEVARFNAQGAPLNLTLPVYESTSDPGVVSVTQLHMFLEFQSATEVTVGQLYVFSNRSDRTYSATLDQLLLFNLPAGATALNVQNAVPERDFFRTADGFGMLSQVAPGDSTAQLLVSFRLPYAGRLNYSQGMPLPVDTVNLLVSDLGIKVTGPGLLYLGPQTVQGQTFQTFSAAALAAGAPLTFAATGAALTGATTPASGGGLAGTSPTGLAVGLGALALALLGIGLWLYLRPRPMPPALRREALLTQLAELDAAYAAGDLAQADYVAERAALKTALAEIWAAAQAEAGG